MGFKNLFGLSYLVLVVLSQQVLAKGPCYNQNINQDVKGSAGVVNQVITQDIDDPCPKSEGSVNQNIRQDVTSKCGNPESINQNIDQKIKHGCNCIEQKSCRAIKNHEKRSNKPYACEDIIFRRHHKPCSNNRDSSEEIRICDRQQSTEICCKTHEDRWGDLSEDSSEEITIKYGRKKPCECQTSEEIVLPRCEDRLHLLPKPCEKKCCSEKSREVVVIKKKCGSSEESNSRSEEITIRRSKPCGLKQSSSSSSSSSSEEIDCKSVFKACEFAPRDVSSEEDIPNICTKNGEKIVQCGSSSEESILKPCGCKSKPCGCKKSEDNSSSCSSSSSSSSSSEEDSGEPCGCEKSSEEIILKPCEPAKPKPCGCKEPEDNSSSCSSSSSSSEEDSGEPCGCQKSLEKIIVKPCGPAKPKPCEDNSSSCSSSSSSSSEEEEIIIKPCGTPKIIPWMCKKGSSSSSSSSEEEIIVKPCCKLPKRPVSSEEDTSESNESSCEVTISKPCQTKPCSQIFRPFVAQPNVSPCKGEDVKPSCPCVKSPDFNIYF